jgi:hypothetical protein
MKSALPLTGFRFSSIEAATVLLEVVFVSKDEKWFI